MEEVFVCTICGEIFDEDKLTRTGDGELVCDDCLEENYEQCDECGEYYPSINMTDVNGDLVCEECLNTKFVVCDDCGEYVRESETTYLDNYSTTVCDACLNNNYHTCCCCDTIVSEDDVRYNESGDAYCEDCYNDHYYHCEDCGCELSEDEVHWVDGDPYCDDCASDHEEYDDDDIYSYHGFDSSGYIPRYSKDDNVNETPDLYGLELEVAGSRCYASDVIDILKGNAVAMSDSSVDGFELVFMPVTRKYLYNELKPILKEALKFLIDNDFEGHNRGGIHIHFTKIPTSLQVANMTQILYGSEKDKKIWLKITQRRPENMHWCSMNSSVPDADEIIKRDIYAPAGTGNHGTALNYCTRTNTHELRIFNSNLRLERILKDFECVFALQDYVKEPAEPICDTRGFLQFVDKHAEDYPHLVGFLHEKRVFEIAHNFYGDTYISKITKDETIEEVTGAIEDMTERTTDEEIQELAVGVA